MNAVLNILVIVFVLTMAYWWATQGGFSALLQLLVVIVSGTIAFALWETFAIGPINLMGMNPHYAWGVGLLLPFGVLLIGLRIATDQLIPRNVFLPPMVNGIIGGVLGFFAGVLVAGITIVGMGFLPMPQQLMGYQRFVQPPQSPVQVSDQGLWMKVDDWAMAFFYRLSNGSFATGTPLAEYQPGLADRASLIRLRDDNISVTMQPTSIKVLDMYTEDTPLRTADDSIKGENGKLSEMLKPGHTVVVVDTSITKTVGVYDGDGVLRLSPAQMVLTTVPKERNSIDTDGGTYTAVGYTEVVTDEAAEAVALGQRQFNLLQGKDNVDYATTIRVDIEWGWVFIIPSNEKPHLLWARSQRLILPDEPNNAPDAFRIALGATKVVESTVKPEPTDVDLGPRDGKVGGLIGENLAITNALPRAFSMNQAPTSLTIRSQELVSGRGDIEPPSGRISNATRVDKLQTSAGTRMLRLSISPDLAKSLYGRARQAAATLNPPYLVDDRGTNWYSIGYVWQKPGDILEIDIDRDRLLDAGRKLPMDAVERQGGQMYLYFNVEPGVRITKFMFGGDTQQELDLFVPEQ